jgi:hypothetical protein
MMTHLPDWNQRLRASRWGVVLAMLTILFGFAMGGAFGAAEDSLRAGLQASGDAVLDSVYGGDTAKLKGVLDKSWAYLKRAHLHGGGIGAAVLVALGLLAALTRPSPLLRTGLSLGLGLGGLGYSVFWLLAARAAPRLGSTGLAKESLAWLAVPSAGLLLAGFVAVLGLLLLELFFTPARSATGPAPE